MKLAWVASLVLVGGCMVPVGLNVQQVAVATLQPAESPAAVAPGAAGGSPGSGAGAGAGTGWAMTASSSSSRVSSALGRKTTARTPP